MNLADPLMHGSPEKMLFLQDPLNRTEASFIFVGWHEISGHFEAGLFLSRIQCFSSTVESRVCYRHFGTGSSAVGHLR